MEGRLPDGKVASLSGDAVEEMNPEETLEGGVGKEEITGPLVEGQLAIAEDKTRSTLNASTPNTTKTGSGDCVDSVGLQPPTESVEDGTICVKEGTKNSVDGECAEDPSQEVSSGDKNSEEKPIVSGLKGEATSKQRSPLKDNSAELKTAERLGEGNLATISDQGVTSLDDLGAACAQPSRTRCTKDDSRTVVDFEDEGELWLWMNDIIDQCHADFIKEHGHTLTELVSQTTAEEDGDQNQDGVPWGILGGGQKRTEDDMLHEKLNIRRQEFSKELLRRVIIRAYGRHLPRGVNPSELGRYFFEVLPDLFSRIAWFDASYSQVEMNDPDSYNAFSLFIVPGVQFWGHIPLPCPPESRLSVGQQKCRLEELLLWAEFSRKCFAKVFFSVADKYKIPKFWKVQVANFDKVVLALREKVAELKKLKKRDLRKLAQTKTFLNVFEEAYDNLNKACEKYLMCPKCDRQFQEAVAFEVCGHELCTNCVADCLRSRAPCPVCRTELKGTRFLPVWRFGWYEELKGQQSSKTPDCQTEPCLGNVDKPTAVTGSDKTCGMENADDSRQDSEVRGEDGRTEISEQDMGLVSEDFESLSVDDDGLETLPTAKCG